MSDSHPRDQSQMQGPPQIHQQQQMHGETVMMNQPVQGVYQEQPQQQVQMQQMPQMLPQGQQMQQMVPQGQQMQQMVPQGQQMQQMVPQGQQMQQMVPQGQQMQMNLQGQHVAGPVQVIYVQAPPQVIAVVDTTNWNTCAAGNPPPVMFNTLGPGKLCEIGGCGKQAYMICGKDKGFYQGGIGCCCEKVKQCGRMCCENHIEVVYGKHASVQFYCCKEPGQSQCRKSYRNHTLGCFGILFSFFCIFFFGNVAQGAVRGNQNYGYNRQYSYNNINNSTMPYNNNGTKSSYNNGTMSSYNNY